MSLKNLCTGIAGFVELADTIWPIIPHGVAAAVGLILRSIADHLGK